MSRRGRRRRLALLRAPRLRTASQIAARAGLDRRPTPPAPHSADLVAKAILSGGELGSAAAFAAGVAAFDEGKPESAQPFGPAEGAGPDGPFYAERWLQGWRVAARKAVPSGAAQERPSTRVRTGFTHAARVAEAMEREDDDDA